MIPMSASAAISNSSQIYTTFTRPDIQAILSEMGVSTEIRSNGAIFATAPSGYKFFVYFTACDSQGVNCLGIDLFSFYIMGEGNASVTKANTFNYNYPFAKAYALDNANMGLARYVTADDGIARGNIYSNISNYLGIAQKYGDYLYNGALSFSEGASAKKSALDSLPHPEFNSLFKGPHADFFNQPSSAVEEMDGQCAQRTLVVRSKSEAGSRIGRRLWAEMLDGARLKSWAQFF